MLSSLHLIYTLNSWTVDINLIFHTPLAGGGGGGGGGARVKEINKHFQLCIPLGKFYALS